MINVTNMLKPATQFLNDNAPALLTAFGAVGVVGTAVLTGRATFRAAEVIREEQIDRNIEANHNSPLTKTEKVKLVWPLYIGAVSSGVLSCGAIIMSHRISSRRAAMLAAAYALNEKKLEEYQEKVKEKLGIKKEKEARDEINQDQITRVADGGFEFANPLAGKVWIMEAYTGRPFLSTVETVKRAVNDINAEINDAGAVRLSDFYDELKIPHVSTSDYFGFTRENRLELDWTTGTSPNGDIAVHVFEYVNHPVMNPEREASFR